MLERLKAMFGYSRRQEPQLDAIGVQLANATERNARAGESARQALVELLDRNDGLKGTRK